MLWQACQVLNKLRTGTKKKWIDALGRSTDNPRRSFVRMTKGNWDSCSTRTQSWCHNQSNFAWKQTPLSWKEHKHHTGSSNYESFLKKARDKGVSSHFWIRKMRHQDSGRSIGRDQLMIVEAKHSQIMIVFLISIWTNSRRKFGISSKLQWRDYFVRLYAGKRIGQGGHFCRWSFVRKAAILPSPSPFPPSSLSSLLPLSRLLPSRRRLLVYVRSTWSDVYSERTRSKCLSHLQFDEGSLEVSKQINED